MVALTQKNLSNGFLLTVHGVCSENAGLANLRTYCETQFPGLICDSFYYENIIPYPDLNPAIFSFISRSVREKISLVDLRYIRNHGRKLFIVAHSLGTLAVVKALEMQIPGVQIEGLVLLGSVIPRNQYWDGFVESGQLKFPPLAIIRPLDRVVRLATHVGGDESGARGFIATGVHRPYETFKNGGHTAYDPHDRADVVQAIAQGVQSVKRIPYERWYEQLGFWRKISSYLW